MQILLWTFFFVNIPFKLNCFKLNPDLWNLNQPCLQEVQTALLHTNPQDIQEVNSEAGSYVSLYSGVMIFYIGCYVIKKGVGKIRFTGKRYIHSLYSIHYTPLYLSRVYLSGCIGDKFKFLCLWGNSARERNRDNEVGLQNI